MLINNVQDVNIVTIHKVFQLGRVSISPFQPLLVRDAFHLQKIYIYKIVHFKLKCIVVPDAMTNPISVISLVEQDV